MFDLRDSTGIPIQPPSTHMDYTIALEAARQTAHDRQMPVSIHRISDSLLLTTVRPPEGRLIDFAALGPVLRVETLVGDTLKRAQGYLTDENLPTPWSHPPVALHFQDGSQLYTLNGPTGTDGGSFDTNPPTETLDQLTALVVGAHVESIDTTFRHSILNLRTADGTTAQITGHQDPLSGHTDTLCIDQDDDSYLI